jgi:hypothetical protein
MGSLSRWRLTRYKPPIEEYGRNTGPKLTVIRLDSLVAKEARGSSGLRFLKSSSWHLSTFRVCPHGQCARLYSHDPPDFPPGQAPWETLAPTPFFSASHLGSSTAANPSSSGISGAAFARKLANCAAPSPNCGATGHLSWVPFFGVWVPFFGVWPPRVRASFPAPISTISWRLRDVSTFRGLARTPAVWLHYGVALR